MSDPNDTPPPPDGGAPPDPLAGLTDAQRRAIDSQIAAARRAGEAKASRRDQAAPSPPSYAPKEIATRTAAYLSAGYDADQAAELAIGNFALPPPPPKSAAQPQQPPPPRASPLAPSVPPAGSTVDRDFDTVFKALPEDAARDTWQAYVRRKGANPANPYDPRNRAAWREMRKQFEASLARATIVMGARRQ